MIVIILFLSSEVMLSQNLEQIGKGKPIKVKGSVGTNQTFYHSWNISHRRPPYLWYFNGNLNFDIYGWSVPFTAIWSNQTRQVRQPFNHYGLSPVYRWITFHAGYRSLSYSSYTLSGYTLLGGGMEINKGILKFSCLYGRFNKATKPDSSVSDLPMFKRMGGGVKIGVGKNSDFIDLIVFKAKDEASSLPAEMRNQVLPAENLVFGIVIQKKISKTIFASGEIASSAYTRDITAPVSEKESPVYFKKFVGNKTTTQYHKAFKTSLNYNGKLFTLQLAYERIDPEYKTLGNYFFNNDLENFTAGTSFGMWKNKLQTSVTTGVQRNISSLNSNRTSRLVNSINFIASPTPKLGFTFQYSNFTTYSKVSSKYNQLRNIDSLNFFQINENYTLGLNYSWGGKEVKKSLGGNVTRQKGKETRGEEVIGANAAFYSSSFYLRIQKKDGISSSSGVNLTQNRVKEQDMVTCGPFTSVSKGFLKGKYKPSLNLSLNKLIGPGAKGAVINTIFSNAFNVDKSNAFTFSVTWIRKTSDRRFSEMTGNFGYNYTF